MVARNLKQSLKTSPLDLVLLAVRLPLVVGAHLGEGELEGGREGNDDGAGVVLVHVLLDLEQPAKKMTIREAVFAGTMRYVQASLQRCQNIGLRASASREGLSD